MYKITFHDQPRQGEEDYESGSITLTQEQYQNLPELSTDIFNEKCKFKKGSFSEKVRYPEVSFPAVWITNDDWHLGDAGDGTGGYLDDKFQWVFVCLDMEADIWIAFKFWDCATVAEAYCATVSVSFPCHGKLYRLDSKCKEIVQRFYN